MSTRAPSELEALADEILRLVKSQPVGGGRGDTAALVMHGAYLRAWRRFRRIRDVVGLGAGEESIILTRALLSLVARAIYVDIPADSVERQARYRSYAKRHLADRIATTRALQATGLEVDADVLADDERQLETYSDAAGFPTDRALFESLNLSIFHDRIYRVSSDYVHFSLGLAIDELRAGDVTFENDESELAQEALALAVLVYGLFIQLSEKSVEHGLDNTVRALVTSSPVFDD